MRPEKRGDSPIDGQERICQVCGEAIAVEEGAVFCRDCGTAHHEECFRYAGRCSTYACLCVVCVDGEGEILWEGEEARLLPDGSESGPGDGPGVDDILREVGEAASGLAWTTFSGTLVIAVAVLVWVLVTSLLLRLGTSGVQHTVGALVGGFVAFCFASKIGLSTVERLENGKGVGPPKSGWRLNVFRRGGDPFLLGTDLEDDENEDAP